MCVCVNLSVRMPSSECLLLAISYIAERVRGTRELDTATQAFQHSNLTCVYMNTTRLQDCCSNTSGVEIKILSQSSFV